VWQAGGFPLEFPVSTLSETFQKPTPMLYRNPLAMETEERDAAHPRDAPGARARLRVEVTPGARCRFLADTGDGAGFRPSGQVFAATPWGWTGALLGLFTAAPPGTGAAGTGVFTRYRTTELHRGTHPTREKSRP
jgi:hypothetical protein